MGSTSGMDAFVSHTETDASSGIAEPRRGAGSLPSRSSPELLFDHPDRAWRRPHEVERPELLERRVEVLLPALVQNHHQARVLAEAPLHDASHRDLVAAEDVGDSRQDARLVGYLQVQIEGGGEIAGDRQLGSRLVYRSVAGEDRHDVAEYRRGGLGAAGAGA